MNFITGAYILEKSTLSIYEKARATSRVLYRGAKTSSDLLPSFTLHDNLQGRTFLEDDVGTFTHVILSRSN